MEYVDCDTCDFLQNRINLTVHLHYIIDYSVSKVPYGKLRFRKRNKKEMQGKQT